MRRVVDDVLHDLDPVRTLDQRFELGADLALTGVGNFVVMDFDLDPHLFHRHAHRGAQILQLIDGRDREIAAFDRGPVTHVAAFELFGGRPRGLRRKYLAVAARHVDRPLDRVENEELRLRTEVGGVAKTR